MTLRRAALPAVVAALAIALRVIPLFFPAIWFDEVHTLLTASFPAPRLIELASVDSHPPLYFLLVRGVMLAASAVAPSACSISLLRIASVVPGLILCLVGWRLARRGADSETAAWTALLLAVSPALCFYSVELRNYGPSQCALVIATWCLVRFMEAAPAARWLWSLGYVLCATSSLYLQNLSALYLLAHGLLYMDEIRRADRRSGLAGWGIAVAVAIAVLHAPWLPRILHQTRFQNTATFHATFGMDFPNTYLLFLPFGGLHPAIAPWTVTGKVLSALSVAAALTLAACWLRAHAGMLRDRGLRLPPLPRERILRHAFVLATVPLAIAFLFSASGIAKVFLPIRYNMLAAPFFLIALVRFCSPAPRLIRWFILGGLATLSLPICLATQINRSHLSNDAACLVDRPGLENFGSPGSTFWTDSRMTPWLSRLGPFEFASPQAALDPSRPLPDTVWFLTHKYTNVGGSWHTSAEAALNERLLNQTSGVEVVPLPGCFGWGRLWRATPAAVHVLREKHAAILSRWETGRAAVPGGRVILPDDPAFADDTGWSPVELMEDFRPWRWTIGGEQRLDWLGPATPGRYQIRIQMWRQNPYPEEEMILECRWPGAPGFQSYRAPLGNVEIVGEVETSRPNQLIGLRLRIPTWIPRERIEGSADQRPLGLQFLSLSMAPVAVVEP